MNIQNIFAKPIDRDIKGVIKVGQGSDETVRQELEEYVVTRELQKHFAEFFSIYKKGIVESTDETGVWISGFFGSGKSHFLQILSYLLENKVVYGKSAVDYFIDDNKISDSMVLADMKLAAETPTDVILFNVDAKGEKTGSYNKDAILAVFLKAFNEMLGYCGAYPYVADLERRLNAEGKYEEFKTAFENINGASWIEERYAIDFIQDDIVDTLVEINFLSSEAARNWCEKATEPYSISIDRFIKMVKNYIESKGNNHHVVFLVDEIGQYIGDDSNLMLDLQTITEQLGVQCLGRAWVVVTSQQDVDSVIKVNGNDFSKIQGRFDTKLSLSSSNVDEVIKKRILEKNETGRETLSLLYDDKATVIKNLILFNDGIEKKLYSDRNNFASVYPFVPYQFNLLGSVLTAIRTHGASGKHLADGERSMLALFKESAAEIKNEQPGKLISFNMFYEPLKEFLDHSHRSVITRALENEYLNPDKAKNCFDVDVLKTLFMIKYVKEIKANIDNITSLMVTDINEDRLALRQKVEDALKRLIRQTLVQKNGENYVFLTNEEQEINRAIESQPVELAEVTSKVSELIFDGLYDEKKYRFPFLNGRYSYGFNQYVDDKPYKANQNYVLSLRILTPDSDEVADETTMKILSSQKDSVIVMLPDDRAFLDEIRSSIQIEKYIRYDATNAVTKYEQIKASKKIELREHNEQAKLYLEEALKAGTIYVNGDKLQSTAKEIVSKINDAMGKLASSIFHKLNYIDTATSESDIRAILKDNSKQLSLGDVNTEKNKLALDDVNNYIASHSIRHNKISMKTLMDRFMAPPYGFVEADVQWLVAKLFKNGDISIFVNSEAVTILNKSVDEIVRYLTRKEYVEKLMTEKRVKANDKQKKAVREIMYELSHITLSSDDDDLMMKSFKDYSLRLKGELDKYEIQCKNQPKYPGRSVINNGKRLLNEVEQMKYPNEFFAFIDDKYDDFLDFAEDYEPVKKFFTGEQVSIFDKAIKLMEIYEASKTFIVDEKVESLVAEITAIMRKPAPYNEIYKLPSLLEDYIKAYGAILRENQKPVFEAIEVARARVFEELQGKNCKEKLSKSFVERFAEIRKKAEGCNNIAVLKNITIEVDALKVRLLNTIAIEEEKCLASMKPVDTATDTDDAAENIPTPAPVKRMKTVSIKSINNASTWQIKSEDDVKRYVAELEKKLIKALEPDTIINIEF